MAAILSRVRRVNLTENADNIAAYMLRAIIEITTNVTTH